MIAEYGNYIITAVGLLGFFLAGKKIWWAWYVNIANQILWFIYGWVTDQWGFVVGTLAYTIVFVKNAYSWTRERGEDMPEEIQIDKRCPSCGRGPGENCMPDCWATYRQEAGQTKHDGADYIRELWAKNGAPVRGETSGMSIFGDPKPVKKPRWKWDRRQNMD